MSDDLLDSGWMSGIRHILSSNFDKRPLGETPSLLVVHAISLPPNQFGGAGVEQLFTNTLCAKDHPFYAQIDKLRVSSHFFIRRDAELIQFVSVLDRAWHAGVSSWNGRERCNDFSIGVELEGCDRLPFEAVQYACLARLVKVLQKHFSIKDIVGHSDIAPGRKTDPGPYFDWKLLRTLLADISNHP